MAEAVNSSQLKEAFTGHLEQTEGHLRPSWRDLHRLLTDSGNSERVHASTFDIDENALVVMGARFLTRVILHRPLACKG